MQFLKSFTVLVLAVLPVVQCQASEKDELALVMRQLDQVQAGLDRARVIANQNQNARFYFDYQQATRDIATMKQGISTYLEPSRAQPTVPTTVTGQYRGEEPAWR
ncbi:RAQPRD family integrative conjugative element protein [Phytobacter diazotrophicus]|jgi:RAQPRD family integrative conjugative element protein|uniref:integrative conjugative element protein, RAQPRD family n=1 Tax=Phytobacter diazotrophicus TaxID=395631 RepID=UPI0029130114|nr:RAQPRD family integrative conjugative element protein [Enterobacteriaceae bacterium]MDU4355640.1 RAQPRD family integrative conjugative element protein [Phytobacter diazotrophicus]